MKAEAGAQVPGVVYVNRKWWWWRGTLPGETKRSAHPLKMPGAVHALSADRPRETAESCAARLWEDAVRRTRRRESREATAGEVCDAYLSHAHTYYRDRSGKKTGTVSYIVTTLRHFRAMFSSAQLCDLSHADMLRFRDALIERGYHRTSVNRSIWVMRSMVAWALDAGLIPALVKAELSQVRPLKPFRSAAPEGTPVVAAPDADVEAVASVCVPNLAAMIRVHRLTGMRPGEICSMRWSLIERRDDGIWVYRPNDHKNLFRGQPRVVCIGPRAQALLESARREGEDPCFSPAAATSERLAQMREARRTKVQPSQIDRSDPEAMRKPGPVWDVSSYARSVARAVERAGVAAWSPNQLRHSCATAIRRACGIQAAGAVLGHSLGCRITDRYSFEAAEDELIARSREAIMRLG